MAKVFVIKEICGVLQKHSPGTDKANAFKRFRPAVLFVVCTKPFPGHGEGLAGEAGGKDINHSRICAGVPASNECSDIAKDGGVIEETIDNSLFDNSLTVFISLHVSDMTEPKKLGTQKSAAGARKKA
jgi:hypothetical protein